VLTRQKIVLALLDELDGAVGTTVLVKLVFLLRHETRPQDDHTFYDFVPYKFGPFSFGLYHELQGLARDGYVTDSDEAFSLPKETSHLAREQIEGLTSADRCAVATIVSRYARMRKDDLVKDVYARYPRFATRSELKGFVQKDQEPAARADVAVYTVGYEGRSVDGFFDHLLRQGMQAILDVRANPVSRKYGFAKRSLSEIAGKLGLGYCHLPALGIPSEQRQGLCNFNSYQRLLDSYERDVLPRQTGEIHRLIGFLRQRPSVLVCMERDVRQCHRGRLAQAASARSRLSVKHL
jgi:uncharacterized protein (DUF488 family)